MPEPLSKPPAETSSAERLSVGRGAVAVIVGLLAAASFVLFYQAVFFVLPIAWSDPEGWQRMLEGQMPDPPGAGMLAFSLVMDSVAAALGGGIAAWIARLRPRVPLLCLAGIFTLGAALSMPADLEAGLPLWVPLGRLVLMGPVALLAGLGLVKNRLGDGDS